MDYFTSIKEYIKKEGYITINDANNIGIYRHVLADLAKEGKLERVGRGLYTLPGDFYNEFAILQEKNKRIIYSYGTALYFHGLSTRTPSVIHLSVPQGYNVSHIENHSNRIRFHYVKREHFKIGIENIDSPQGKKITVYNMERCICDIVKDRDKIDDQVFVDSIRAYFNSDEKNLQKLWRYSKIFNIESEIRKYAEVLL